MERYPPDPAPVLERAMFGVPIVIPFLIPGMGIVIEPNIWSFITSPPSLKRPAGSGGGETCPWTHFSHGDILVLVGGVILPATAVSASTTIAASVLGTITTRPGRSGLHW